MQKKRGPQPRPPTPPKLATPAKITGLVPAPNLKNPITECKTQLTAPLIRGGWLRRPVALGRLAPNHHHVQVTSTCMAHPLIHQCHRRHKSPTQLFGPNRDQLHRQNTISMTNLTSYHPILICTTSTPSALECYKGLTSMLHACARLYHAHADFTDSY